MSISIGIIFNASVLLALVYILGGYANEDTYKMWDNNTLSLYFSATKGVTSVVIAMLVDR